jgi:hypothetical protein
MFAAYLDCMVCEGGYSRSFPAQVRARRRRHGVAFFIHFKSTNPAKMQFFPAINGPNAQITAIMQDF